MKYFIYNVRYHVKDITPNYLLTDECNQIDNIIIELNQLIENLDDGGLLFITGLPFIVGQICGKLNDYMVFKYWIACELEPIENKNDTPISHYGIGFYQKVIKKPKPYTLNTFDFRVPHTYCPSCDKMTKDWGGKKHMLNPNGTAYSDVWGIDDKLKLQLNDLSPNILNIIKNLVETPEDVVYINSTIIYDDRLNNSIINIVNYEDVVEYEYDNKVLNIDCIQFVEGLKEKYPDGVYDIAFSDPPYNLNKNYNKYEDNLRDSEYLMWCEEWLENKIKSLKPGGSLFVMNIPKWSIHHFNFLIKHMYFDKWIVWDALSTPAGKLMPAHYSVLHFVKPGKPKKVTNFMEYIPLKEYCLRQTCINNRTNTETKLVNDFWRDCHRVKHQKNKNDHPCQLPIKLLNRIIVKYSYENDRLFDPFGGTGSLAVAGKLKKRKFTLTDIDIKYCEISEKNVERVVIDENGDLIYNLPKIKNTKIKSSQNNRLFEETYINLCIDKGKVIDKNDLEEISNELYKMLEVYPKSFKKLQSLVKRLHFK
jgi:site-specific DNA-methyltransferase (adenine-specific)